MRIESLLWRPRVFALVRIRNYESVVTDRIATLTDRRLMDPLPSEKGMRRVRHLTAHLAFNSEVRARMKIHPEVTLTHAFIPSFFGGVLPDSMAPEVPGARR